MKKYKLYCDDILKESIIKANDDKIKLDFKLILASGTLYIGNILLEQICQDSRIFNYTGMATVGVISIVAFKSYMDFLIKSSALHDLEELENVLAENDIYIDFNNVDIMDKHGKGCFYGKPYEYEYALVDKDRCYSILANNYEIIYVDNDNSYDITDVVMSSCLSYRKYKKYCKSKDEEK